MTTANTEIEVHDDGSISVPVWWRTGGGGMIRRDCLDANHPENTYNYLKRKGYTPENYGVWHPNTERMDKFRDWSPQRLAARIIELEDELMAGYRSGF